MRHRDQKRSINKGHEISIKQKRAKEKVNVYTKKLVSHNNIISAEVKKEKYMWKESIRRGRSQTVLFVHHSEAYIHTHFNKLQSSFYLLFNKFSTHMRSSGVNM